MILDFPVRYALFDMDGTLTDTMPFWHGIPQKLLAAEGLSITAEQEDTLETLGLVKGIEYIRSLHLSPKADRFGEEDVARVLIPCYERGAVAKPSVELLLRELRACGAKMGVATLSPTSVAQVCLSKTGLIDYFDFILGGEDYPEGKSSPRIFLDAAKEFGCAPAEMHLFEDSFYSIKTAREIGIPVVGVADESRAKERDAIIAASVAFFECGFSVRVK